MQRLSPSMRPLDVDPAARVIRSVISTSAPDRAGDVVAPTGLRNRDEYLRNPVVLWAHQRLVPPIGRCRKLEVEADRIIAETEFARGQPLAEELFHLYEQGILRAWSVGLVPLRTTPLRRGQRIDAWELLEYSAVPVPENPAALTLAISKGAVRDPMLKRWLVGDAFELLVA